jgi:glycosyltransferase involved in cell wall biosynthesis
MVYLKKRLDRKLRCFRLLLHQSRYFMLKILHLVSYSLWSGPLPGVVGLVRAQKKLGHDVCIGYDTLRGAFNPYEEAAAPYLQSETVLPCVLSAKSTPVQIFKDVWGLRRWVLEHAPDVVHVHLSHDHALASFALLGLPVVLIRTVHASRSFSGRLGQDLWMSGVSGVVLRSERDLARCKARYRWMPEKKMRVIEGGVDVEFFRPLPEEVRRNVREGWGVSEEVCLLGHVALMVGRGQEELIEAMALLPEKIPVHVVLVGRGEREKLLDHMIAERGLGHRVKRVGYQQGQDLVRTYAGLDAVFVAQAGNDGSVRAMLEGMACAKPVLAVDADGLSEWVDSSRGHLTRRTPADIALALEKMCLDPEKLKKGQASWEYVHAQRTLDVEAQKTVDWYEFCLGKAFDA